ncbi:MAG: hypothetical protein AB8B67_02430 [Rickettsiaceae bacterium]
MQEDSDNQLLIPIDDDTNLICGKYLVQFDANIDVLNNAFCKYYEAINVQTNDEYFAIAFNNSFNPPIDVWNKICRKNIPGLNNLIAYSLVRNQDTLTLIAIVDKYDFNRTLTQYINTSDISEEQLKKIITTISNILGQCNALGIICGNIHPDNVIVKDNDEFMLREFIDSYAHYNQSGYFLAPEILEASPIARCTNTIAADIYAFGVLVFCAYSNKTLNEPNQNLQIERFNNGSCQSLIKDYKVSKSFKIFFMSTIQDDITLRWDTNQISNWLNKPNDAERNKSRYQSQNDNSIVFNNKNYFSIKALSYGLFMNWQIAINFIKDDKLFRFLNMHNINTEEINKIHKEIRSALLGIISSYDISISLSRLLLTIDRQGCIRFNNLGFTAASLPNLLHNALYKHDQSSYENIIKITQNLHDIKTKDKSFASSFGSSDNESLIDSAIFSSFSTSNMYDTTRIVYVLNKYAKCLSPILSGEYVLTSQEMLIALENIAQSNPGKFTIDRHIIAFLAAKMYLQDDSYITILPNFTNLSNHELIRGFCVIHLAHKQFPDIKIDHLVSNLIEKIIILLDQCLHNVEIKNKMFESLRNAAQEVNLDLILKILSNQQSFIEDYNGYYQSCKSLKQIKEEMISLKKSDNFNDMLFFGQKITVFVSYVFCLIAIIVFGFIVKF